MKAPKLWVLWRQPRPDVPTQERRFAPPPGRRRSLVRAEYMQGTRFGAVAPRGTIAFSAWHRLTVSECPQSKNRSSAPRSCAPSIKWRNLEISCNSTSEAPICAVPPRLLFGTSSVCTQHSRDTRVPKSHIGNNSSRTQPEPGAHLSIQSTCRTRVLTRSRLSSESWYRASDAENEGAKVVGTVETA